MSRSEDSEAAARAERLAAALRANLKRRKAQSRGRQAVATAEVAEASEEALEPVAIEGAVDKGGNPAG